MSQLFAYSAFVLVCTVLFSIHKTRLGFAFLGFCTYLSGEWLLRLIYIHAWLCGYWLLCMCFIFPLIACSHSIVQIRRKYFHLLAVLMFGPPIIDRADLFLCVAGISVCGVFVVVEFVRRNFDELRPLNRVMEQYLDKKDLHTKFVSSHIQLLIASLLPVALSDDTEVRLAGLLTIGIGDSFAAIGGLTSRKTHKLPKSEKTFQGLFSFIVSVTLALFLLGKLSTESAFATIAAGLSECYAKRYDNLIVPLVFSVCIIVNRSFIV